jgi:hypothetical protein
MKIARGATRLVFLTRTRAYKIPTFSSWKLFLNGLLANIQEHEFGTLGWEGFCPVLWSIPGGFLVTMPRAEPITDYDWEGFDADHFIHRPHYTIPAELKQSSFGFLDGEIVAVDYG